jgi:2-polyprenyl-6-methoxyphenol hydroxylase-like FAD-dependent oxidoreductase
MNGKSHVVIAGAGIGGLCTAIALQRNGFKVTVYEQAEKITEVGAGLTIWENAMRVLRTLGLADQVIRAGSILEHFQLKTDRGETLYTIRPGGLKPGFNELSIAIHRADLHEILIDALTPGSLKLNKTCTGFTQNDEGVVLEFASGETDSADLLIAADGIHSTIRKRLFPRIALRYAGYTAWRGVVENDDEVVAGMASEIWGSGARFGIVRIDPGRVYWFAIANQPAGERCAAKESKARLLRKFSDWYPPVMSLIEGTPVDTILQNDIYDFAPLPRWTMGRITMLGDAAHATTPNMGQGACMAIESAYSLSQSLSMEQDHSRAFARYERERHARTARVTHQSHTFGRMGQLENGFLCEMRNGMMRLMPDRMVKRQLRQTIGYDVTGL